MNIQLKQYNKHLIFEAVNNTGYSLLVGTSKNNAVNAIRPMDLLLVSLASCSSIDIIEILSKQKQTDFEYDVQVESDRVENQVPAIFKNITLNYIFKGNVSPLKAKKAVDLSLEKYCSVSKIIEQTAKINYIITVNGTQYEH